MKMNPVVSYLVLLSLRWSTHSSVSWTERLSSCFYSSMQRRLNRLSNFSHDNKLLALMDMKGFDPKEVTVTVKDGKVKVLAEHREEHATAEGKEYNYRSTTKEISLPPGVSKDEVTYSLGPNSIMKIEIARKCYPCLLSPLQGDCTCCPGLSTWACTPVGSSISFPCRKACNKPIYLASLLGKQPPPDSGFLSPWG
uniref:Outer dense fiber protein 1 n=1 Tax=Athene cunicularia TaxID=194338 RepID=A0A663N4S4_ATHCN